MSKNFNKINVIIAIFSAAITALSVFYGIYKDSESSELRGKIQTKEVETITYKDSLNREVTKTIETFKTSQSDICSKKDIEIKNLNKKILELKNHHKLCQDPIVVATPVFNERSLYVDTIVITSNIEEKHTEQEKTYVYCDNFLSAKVVIENNKCNIEYFYNDTVFINSGSVLKRLVSGNPKIEYNNKKSTLTPIFE